MPHELFATAARGTEGVLADELRELGLAEVEPRRGGVGFRGDLEAAYRACLWSRVATRILLKLSAFEAEGPDALYEGVLAIPWTDHLHNDLTFAVSSVAPREAWANGKLLALRSKDAIADHMRARTGARPDVNKERPDLRVHVHLSGSRVTVSLDLAGESLHKRGVGRQGARAPLKENLAAAMLRLMGWPEIAAEGGPLVDPLCGSGTILVEAAWMALGIAPGLRRRGFAFERWLGHDPEIWQRLREEAREPRPLLPREDLRILGFDRAERAAETARENLRRAGVGDVVSVQARDLVDLRARPDLPPGLALTNPPYGIRLGEAGALAPLYQALGDTLRRHFLGYRAGVLTGNRALAGAIGLKPAARHVLFNGPIECRLLDFPISARPVEAKEGPGWRKPSEDAPMLVNRLKKNARRWRRWARTAGTSCYRLYDADIPEYNVAVDWYDGAVHIQEYHRPRRIPEVTAARRLQDVRLVAPEVLGVADRDVHLKVRLRRRPGEQYEKIAELGQLREVSEYGLRFLVNLTDHLDTGLFLDQRLVRRRIAELSQGKSFCNLFAYTCTATVAAAAAGAARTASVDRSRSYLEWGRKNLEINGHRALLLGHDEPRRTRHALVRADAMRWMDRARERFDVIYAAPAARSISRDAEDFDLVRDHVRLIRDATQLLAGGGVLLLSSPVGTLDLDMRRLRGLRIEEWTDALTPEDFRRGPRPFRCWAIRRRF